MDSNIFMNCASTYYSLLDSIYETNKNKEIVLLENPSILSKKVSYNSNQKNLMDSLRQSMDYIQSVKDLDRPFEDWMLFVEKFARFVNVAQKIYFFDNSNELNNVYTSYDSYAERLTIDFVPYDIDIKIHISFLQSAINMPGVADPILGFMSDDNTLKTPNMVTFVDIKIERIATDTVDEYKFVLDSAVSYESKEHELLLLNIRHIISMMIFDCFNDILNNYVTKVTYLGRYNITVKDVLNNELYVR